MKELNKIKLFFVIIMSISLLTASAVSAEWAKCEGIQLWTGGESLNGYGLRVYYSASKYLLFLDDKSGVTKYCYTLGPGWEILGFRSFPGKKDTAVPVIVLEVRNGLDTRYYNVQNGREIFLHDRGNREVYADHAPLKKTGQALSVVQQWSGAVTKIQTVEYHRVLDQGTWKALWERHLGQGVVVPQVDFTAHMVIAIFPGKKINSSGVKAVDARLEEGAVYFDYDYEIYKPKGRVDMMLAFGFFVIPQAKQKIILRENMQNGVGDLLPAWKVVKEFEALK